MWPRCASSLWALTNTLHVAQAFATPSKQLRPYFAQFAKLPQFSHVIFVEIDVETMSVSPTGSYALGSGQQQWAATEACMQCGGAYRAEAAHLRGTEDAHSAHGKAAPATEITAARHARPCCPYAVLLPAAAPMWQT